MKKNLFFAALALVALASCSDEQFVGEINGSPDPGTGPEQAILFNSGAYPITRANDFTGKRAADSLRNNFVVEGIKSNGTSSSQKVVFDHYNVNYVENTANTTTSNTDNWEYVAQSTHAHANISAQTIKYWDYATTQYDFIAYSKGGATAVYNASEYVSGTNVLVSAIDYINMQGVDSDQDNKIDKGAYTIKGKAADLARFYIADLVTAYRDGGSANDAKGNYNQVVTPKFRSLSAKVRIALYETVPGYSVQDVVFYTDDTHPDNPTGSEKWGKAHLYTKNGNVFNEEGTYTVYFPTIGSSNTGETDYNKAHLLFTPEDGGTKTVKDFGSVDGDTKAIRETAETASTTDKLYLGRASSEATYYGLASVNHYTVVIPNETGAVLNLKVNYKLVSTDGSGEDIDVTGATAQVPAEYTAWKSGYAYTYLFKISQNSNGVTNPEAGPAGLYPITFDAVVMSSEEDGIQETITTVSTPSITTYAQGKIVTENDEYIAGVPVYVIVNNGTSNVDLDGNANLYTVTLTAGAGAAANPSQTINEASVDNAIKNGHYNGEAQTYTVTDANKWNLVVTRSGLMSIGNVIEAADSPTGDQITVGDNMVAKFTPNAANTIYVFQYMVAAATTETYTAATAAAYNATLPGAISTGGEVYSFTSYASDKSTEYGTGKVKVVSKANGWTTVLVTSNSIDGFVGDTYKVNAETMTADTYYELYTAAGVATGIYVKVASSSLNETEVNTYNETLTGHVSNGSTKDIPAKYEYKIIRVQ